MTPNKTYEPYVFYKEYTKINSLIKQLQDVATTAFIGGGCPRDIYFDKPFSDVDIFLSSDADIFKVINILNKTPTATCPEIKTGDLLPAHYQAAHLKAVLTFEAFGLPFQIVIVNRHSFISIMETFAVNISKFYFDGRNPIATHYAQNSMVNKVLIFNTALLLNNVYKQKIIKKFPDYKVMKEKEETDW